MLWVTLCPPRDTLKPQALVPQNVTFLGNKDIRDVNYNWVMLE